MKDDPRSHEFDGLIACYDCDLLVHAPTPTKEEKQFKCPRCKHTFYSGERYSNQYLGAISTTAIILFIAANSFDFLTFSAQGHDVSISLAASAKELWLREFYVLSSLVLTFILVLPCMYLLGLLLLLIPNQWSKNSHAAIRVGRFMSALLPWAMADVFLIGVLVALIKVASIAEIVFGMAFWAYILFTLMYLHLNSRVDRLRLWKLVDERRGIQKHRFYWGEYSDYASQD